MGRYRRTSTSFHRTGGFTLLEILVAMSIFAVIGLGANKMLRTIIDTHEITKAKNQNIISLARVFTTLERDFTQIVPRRIRDEYGEVKEPLLVGTGRYQVELTRTGWNNPAHLKRSNLQRVAYELKDKILTRRFWLVVDRAQDSKPISQEILPDVEDFRINLLDIEGKGKSNWPDSDSDPDSDAALPQAVEVIIKTKQMGEIRRVYALASLAKAIKHGSAQGDNTQGGQAPAPNNAGAKRNDEKKRGGVRTGGVNNDR